MVRVTVRCSGATACVGKVNIPLLDGPPVGFSIPAGTKKAFDFDPAPQLNAHIARLTSIKATLTQNGETVVVPVRLVHTHTADGGGAGGGEPLIEPGPATRYQPVSDKRGDAHSSFPLPQLFDIVRAVAKRQGAAVVLSVTVTSAITGHDGFGNPIAPCVEIPWPAPEQYPMFLFGNGQLSGYTQHYWPKMKTTIRGATISWTVPRAVLAKKGFGKGFRWRATGGCDKRALADTAPDRGFKTFRWVRVP